MLHFFSQKLRFGVLLLFVMTVIVACRSPLFSRLSDSPPIAHSAIIFVADGLRPGWINAADTPTLQQIREQGVHFTNSHSLFPTFTTANASAIATGHFLGDTGDFSNTIHVEFPVKSAKNSPVPFLENNAVLREVNRRFGANYLNEESLLATARKAGLSTAAVGKIGPVWIQDITEQSSDSTIIVDDATGTPDGISLNASVIELLNQKSLALTTPPRGENGKAGDRKVSGTKVPNATQQQYFVDFTTQIILPLFKQRQKPFVLVYWSRDPDGTQHNQGDSLNQLTPGINGPTVLAARQNVDRNLAQIRAALKDLDLEATTNIFVTADHGFSTISKQSQKSYAATINYPDVPKDFLPSGFLAIDLAHHLKLPLFNPDKQNAIVDAVKGQSTKNGAIGKNPAKPEAIVAANGGSDLIYLPQRSQRKALAKTIVDFLLQQDYVSGVFINDSLGEIPGALPFSSIGLKGAARTPTPEIVVNFRSFDTGCSTPTMCGVEIADTGLQQGQGIHGSFSRADTFNTMMAIGPDFKPAYEDAAPASNADVPQTIAKIMGLNLTTQGKLIGRVLTESLAGSTENTSAKSQILESKPAKNGLKTVLKFQTVGKTRYYDTAGFPGRTLGL